MALTRRWAALAAAISLVLPTLAFAAPAHADPVSAPSLVDDGVYPGAAQILAEQNVRLIAGDGHIQIADCSVAPIGDIGYLKVYTTDETIGADGIGRVCFSVSASGGWLTLQVPGVYEIRGDGQRTGTGHEVTADLHSDAGEDITVDVDPDGSTQVGLGADPNASPTMLLQLTAGAGLAPVAGANPAIGKATTRDRMCTVTLVAARWALGASSCFAANPAQPQLTEGVPAEPATVVFPGQAAVAVNWLTPVLGRDAVLVRLATPISGITPLATATTAAPTGTAVSAVGYGRTATSWVYDQQQTASITFGTADATTMSASTGPLLCKGMAGAPVVVGGKVAAVLTEAGQAGCFDITGNGSAVSAVRMDGLAGWITAVTATTGDHTWSLADMPLGAASGAPVATALADNVFTGTALPMTASSGATWKTGETFSPAVELDGVAGSLATTAPPMNTSANFGFSVWVKLDAYGGVVVSQDSSVAKSSMFKLWADPADHAWKFFILTTVMTNMQIPSGDTAIAAPQTAQLGVWTHITVQYQTSSGKNMVLMKINDVPAASTYHNWDQSQNVKNPSSYAGVGPFRIGKAKTSTGTYGNFLDGTVADVQTWSSATLPAGPSVQCSKSIAVYGLQADGRLTYTLIEPYTGTVVRRLTSATALSFTPAALATYDNTTLLIPSTAGALYRVDVTNNTTALTFATVPLGGTGWNFAQLTYDGSYLYGTTSAGAMRIYDVWAPKPLLTDFTLHGSAATGYVLSTLAATGFMEILGTRTSDNAAVRLEYNGTNGFYSYPLATWTNVSHVFSSGAGLYFTRDATSSAVTMRFDANPTDRSGADITAYGPVVDPAGWTQTKLSARPHCW